MQSGSMAPIPPLIPHPNRRIQLHPRTAPHTSLRLSGAYWAESRSWRLPGCCCDSCGGAGATCLQTRSNLNSPALCYSRSSYHHAMSTVPPIWPPLGVCRRRCRSHRRCHGRTCILQPHRRRPHTTKLKGRSYRPPSLLSSTLAEPYPAHHAR